MPAYTGGILYSSEEMGFVDSLTKQVETGWEAWKRYGAKADTETPKQAGPVLWLQTHWKPIVIGMAIMGGAYWYLSRPKKK